MAAYDAGMAFEFDRSDILTGDSPVRLDPLIKAQDASNRSEIARLLDVPPWLIDLGVPRPRFARLRWKVRRVWPVTPR